MLNAHVLLDIAQAPVVSLVDAINSGFFDRSLPGFIPFQRDTWEGWCINGSRLSHFEHDAPVYNLEPSKSEDVMSFPDVARIVAAIRGEICAIRLLRLAPDGFVDFHIDDYEKFGKHDWQSMRKVHVPIITNEYCRNFDKSADGVFSSYWMQPGQYWYLDGTKLHGACNFGDTDRWHLVMEILPDDDLQELIRPIESTDKCKNLSGLLRQLTPADLLKMK